MNFYVGLHHPHHARHFERVMVSVNTLRRRRSDFVVHEWLLDSGAFTEVARHGGYRCGVEDYADQIRRWRQCGRLAAAVAQDWMCEPSVLAHTGKTLAEHQRLTIERYDALRESDGGGVYLMAVVQGYQPDDYARHLDQYGTRLAPDAWVGVGSICKRNRHPREIEAVLLAIHRARPDLRLHGFGVQRTALKSALVQALLYSAASAAWSYAALRRGCGANDWREAKRYVEAIQALPRQGVLFL